MPVFLLGEDIIFPPIHLANQDGILAVGGDLSPPRLLTAYAMGIFPWFNEGDPIWWSPDPRCVLWPKDVHVSRSMRKTLNSNKFTIKFDSAFSKVVKACGEPRKNEPGTWVSDDIINSYTRLHVMGFAHSIEAWDGDKLTGGLYGVSLGKWFFGESMFTRESNASKTAFIALCRTLQKIDFLCVDCQIYNPHLGSLGASMISRQKFAELLEENRSYPTLKGHWGEMLKAPASTSELLE